MRREENFTQTDSAPGGKKKTDAAVPISYALFYL